MYFTRMTFNPLVDHRHLAQQLCQDTYREHQALWQLFDSDPEAKRDFLYRQVIEQGRVKYFVLSERLPVDRSGLWLIDSPKEYNPSLVAGQKLFFMLRANPIVTLSTAEGKKQRHDVVMHEQKHIDYKQLPISERPSLQRLIRDSCVKWLKARTDLYGFDFSSDELVTDAYQQHESRRKNLKSLIRYSTVDFQGVLEVKNLELFRKTLFHGVGKSKAFGCGLLLVRRIS